MRNTARELAGYFAASALALAADFCVLRLLVHGFHWGYLTAATTSFAAGLIVAYVISVTWVFSHRRLEDRRKEFAGFAAIGVIGAAVNAGVMLIAVKYMGLYYMAAKAVAAGFTFVCNFVSRRQMLFVRRPSG